MAFRVRLIPDDYHLPYVGRLKIGGQFWVDLQLRPEANGTRDFVATYVFDLDGCLIWNEVLDLGQRSRGDQSNVSAAISAQLAKLGAFERTDIRVYPFSTEAFGSTFGLVVRDPEPGEEDGTSDGHGPLVDAVPGWTLVFYPPWDEGAYAT